MKILTEAQRLKQLRAQAKRELRAIVAKREAEQDAVDRDALEREIEANRQRRLEANG